MRGHGKGMRQHIVETARTKKGYDGECRTWYKQAYRSKEIAEGVATHQSALTGKRIRVYPCGNHWHLTSK